MKVKELMTKDVLCCSPNESLNRAAQLMWEGDCGVVPVVASDGKLVGVITDRDVCMAAYTKGRPLAALWVEEAMSKKVSKCSPDASLEVALSTMKDARVRRLPVVDDAGRLAGILSMNDVAREARKQSKLPLGQALCADLAQTMGVICESRKAAAKATETRRAGELVGAM